MSQQDFITNAFNLKDVIIDSYEKIDGNHVINIHKPRKNIHCPYCNHSKVYVHDYRKQPIKLPPIGKNPVILIYNKRRYKCNRCNKIFYESANFIGIYKRLSVSLIMQIIQMLKDVLPISQIAKDTNVGRGVVTRILDSLIISKPHLPQIIALDEFKGNAGGEKFQCILVNPHKHKVLDVIENRRKNTLDYYFIKKNENNNVKAVVMDLSSLFKSVAKENFKNADIVADRYHVVRLVTYAIEEIRKEAQMIHSKQTGKQIKKKKKLLLKDPNKLTDYEKIELSRILEAYPKLKNSYYLYIKFRKFLSSSDYEKAKVELSKFIFEAQVLGDERMKKVANTFFEWRSEILNMFKYPNLSNGYIEGINNKTKVLKRVSYGLRNFERFRKRILLINNAM